MFTVLRSKSQNQQVPHVPIWPQRARSWSPPKKQKKMIRHKAKQKKTKRRTSTSIQGQGQVQPAQVAGCTWWCCCWIAMKTTTTNDLTKDHIIRRRRSIQFNSSQIKSNQFKSSRVESSQLNSIQFHSSSSTSFVVRRPSSFVFRRGVGGVGISYSGSSFVDGIHWVPKLALCPTYFPFRQLSISVIFFSACPFYTWGQHCFKGGLNHFIIGGYMKPWDAKAIFIGLDATCFKEAFPQIGWSCWLLASSCSQS